MPPELVLSPQELGVSIYEVNSDDDDSDPEDIGRVRVDHLSVNDDGTIDIPDGTLVPSPFQLGPTPKQSSTIIPFGNTQSRYPMGNCNLSHQRPDGSHSLNRDRELYTNPLVSFDYV